MLQLLGTLGKGIVRAFTKDGGGFFNLKNADGNSDPVAKIAMAYRGFVIFVVLYLIATWLGIDPSEFLQAFKDFSGLN